MRHSELRFALWFLFFVGIIHGSCGVVIAGVPDNVGPVPENGGRIMQFRAEGHILGFGPDRVYMVGLGYALIEQFVEGRHVAPVAEPFEDSGPSYGPRGQGQGDQSFHGVTYRDLWEGITLRYERVSGGLAESVYLVQPGADVERIRIRYNTDLTIQPDGGLRFLHPTNRGYFSLGRPVAWQEINGSRVPVDVAFKRHGDRTLGFVVGACDRAHTLIIDPTYRWHTFYGSTSYDFGLGIAVTGDGLYVAGESDQSWNGDGDTAPRHPHSRENDIVILKLDTAGNYQWHTFYGSANHDYGNGIAVAQDGVYVTGESYQSWNGDGDTPPQHPFAGGTGIVVLKIDTAGNYQWHTFYGSASSDAGTAIAVTGDELYLTGMSWHSWNGDADALPEHLYSGLSDITVLKLSDRPLGAPTQVPAMKAWGAGIMMLLLGLTSYLMLRRRA